MTNIDVLTAVLESKNYTQSESCIAKRIPLPKRLLNSQDYDDIIENMSQEWVRNASVAMLFRYGYEANQVIQAIMCVWGEGGGAVIAVLPHKR